MGRTPNRQSPAGKQSWKQRAATSRHGTPSVDNKHLGRWLLSGLLIALIAVFIWLLLGNRWGERHLVVLPIWSADQLTLAPHPFAREDAAAFTTIENVT